MTTRTPYRASAADFKGWLDSEIWLNDCEKGPRRDYIPPLTHAISDWMSNLGYKMSPQWKPMILAKWLYAISVLEVGRRDTGKALSYPAPCHRDWPEDYDVYSVDVDFSSVSEFLESWATVEDLEYDSLIGRRVAEELEVLIYCYVDMEGSRRGQQLANKLVDSDSDSDSSCRRRRSGRREDIYLLEAKEGYHGGRGAKV